MMSDYEQTGNYCEYSEGDWIVHANFGVGQFKGIEVKTISSKETRYWRIQTIDSTFWMPVNQLDSELFRPLASPEEIQQAIASLQRPPIEMSSDFRIRQLRIQDVRIRNTPDGIARLIRDLRARQRDKGMLNMDERSALLTLKKRLVEEWAIVTGSRTEIVVTKLDTLLNTRTISAD